MNTQSPMTIERALLLYSVEVDQWWDGAGDADQMLSAREWIEDRFDQLDHGQVAVLRRLDNKVVKKAAEVSDESSWDVIMLRKTAEIAARHAATA